MNEIKLMADALGKAICASSVYVEYLELANKMKKKPQALININQLKEMQSNIVPGEQEGAISLEDETKLCTLYSEIAMDEDAIAFWHSERNVIDLIQDTLETIAKQAPINILDEE